MLMRVGETDLKTARTLSMPSRFATPTAATVMTAMISPMSPPARAASPSEGATSSPRIWRGRVAAYAAIIGGSPRHRTPATLSCDPTIFRTSRTSINPTIAR